MVNQGGLTNLIKQRITGSALYRRLVESVAHRAASLPSRPTAADPASTFPLGSWWDRSFWEPTVALAIRDHCRPGDVVFDVGANAGALSLMMSRLVGPRGIVCSFEASPRIVDKTHFNLVKAGCHNVTLYHKAVWHTSGALVNIAAGSHLNDRIEEAASGMSVRTIALDDFAAAGNFKPSFIKMDIEGAEYDALLGMPRLLREARPVLVLEQALDDLRCLTLLADAGYTSIDLASYKPVLTASDFPAGVGLANVLVVPNEMLEQSRYRVQGEPVLVKSMAANQFTVAANGDVRAITPEFLPAGRYIVTANFTADGTNNEIFAGIEADGEVLLRYHTYTKFMASSYRWWVIHLDRESAVTPYIRFLNGSDATLRWTGADIFRIPSFDGWQPPVIE